MTQISAMSRCSPVTRVAAATASVFPGLLLCAGVSAAAIGVQALEAGLFGRAWLEALVIAILLGAAIRTLWTPPSRFEAGIAFAAKTVLEVSIVLLGAMISARLIAGAGLALLAAVVALVAGAVALSYGMGRVFGLPHRLAALIACGNSICGNSAIAAVAPVIGAEGEEVAASIAFTAVLGVVVVLVLPLVGHLLHMTPRAFGAFAGLTVYAVPQVLPATLAVSPASAQMGILVKLMRVLMLGPVIMALSVLGHRRRSAAQAAHRPGWKGLVPWFIVGFLVMVTARSAGLVPAAAAASANQTATLMTIVSMAAMGLGVDVRTVARAGPRVSAVVALSLAALAGLALLLIRLVGLG
jgi:uncharacterized integral membrane protein (TIGR00698 family)